MARKKKSISKKKQRWSKKISSRNKYNPESIKRRTERKRKSTVKLSPIRNDLGLTNYNPQSIREAFPDFKLLKKEYSRLRPTAMKRLSRLGKSRFNKSETYKYYKDRFKKLFELNENEVAPALAEMNRFLQSSLSTITGQTELETKKINTLRDYGYNVNRENLSMVFDIIDYIRYTYTDMMYDSNAIVQDAVDLVNEIIADPNISFTDYSVSELGERIYSKYVSDSEDLWDLPEF